MSLIHKLQESFFVLLECSWKWTTEWII